MERIEPWPFQYTYKDVITVLAWILDAATKEEQVTNRRLSRSAVVAPVGADLRDEKKKKKNTDKDVTTHKEKTNTHRRKFVFRHFLCPCFCVIVFVSFRESLKTESWPRVEVPRKHRQKVIMLNSPHAKRHQ